MIIQQDITELRNMIRDFFKDDISPYVAEYDKSGEHPEDLYERIIEMGLHAIAVPEEFGGSGLSGLAKVVLSEEIGYWDCGLSSAVGANMLAIEAIERIGTPEQKKFYYGIIMSGKLSAFCLTEPNAGSDVSGVASTAVLFNDEYVINGTKCFITNGGIAGVYTVIASTDKSKGMNGLSMFIVEADSPGITIGKEEDKMGIRLSNTTEVVFQDVRIPKSNLLGKEGDGFKNTMNTLNASRLPVGAQSVGLAQRAFDEAVKYAKERIQFKKPIASFQAIQNILSDMAIEIEAARQLVYHATELHDLGLPFAKYSAMAKAKASDVAMKCTIDGLQVFGGYGYMRDYPMEKLVRDAKIMQIYEGTAQIQRQVIAAGLLK